ncbi:hypothetical protein BCD67_15045 [Oscillatoriales cyanobacterium USR001]|nr:hypothetical protein BCD67_15045 [Oscillatoriales cyanobacterium USR001]
MNHPEMFDDDLPPLQTALDNRMLQRQLENSIEKYFYQDCDSRTKLLLSKCEWYITVNANAVVLTIECPDSVTNWRILQNLIKIGSVLENLESAKIRVCPPPGTGTPFEMRVKEIFVYRDSL